MDRKELREFEDGDEKVFHLRNIVEVRIPKKEFESLSEEYTKEWIISHYQNKEMDAVGETTPTRFLSRARKRLGNGKMKTIEITLKEFKEGLSKDPRIKEDYVENIRLPWAFATGNKFLRKYILDKTDYRPDGNIPSDWFQFAQKIEGFEATEEKLTIKYDEEKDTHPPLMSRSIGK